MLYLQTIIVYTSLALMMSFCAYRSASTTSQTKLWGWLPIILFTLVFGLRYDVGIDYDNYVEAYELTEGCDSILKIWDECRFEPGFTLLIFVCHWLQAPVWVLFSIVAFLQIFLLYKTFKDEDNILIYIYATLIFTGFCMYSFMNIIRHEIAFCFFLYSLKYIRDNKLIKYWLCCLLALCFHKSAFLLFPLYFIWIRRKSIFNAPIIEVLLVLACFVGNFATKWQDILHLFDEAIVVLGYEDYIDIADEMIVNSKIGVTRILTLLTTIIIILSSKKIKDHFKSDLFNILYDLFVVGTALSYLFLGSMMLGRIIVYFAHTQFIIWAYALCYLYRTKLQSVTQLCSYALIVLTILVTYSSFIYNCQNNTGAYVSYFQKDLHPLKDQLRTEALAEP